MPSPDPLEPPESEHSPRPWFALDRLGITQALGGLAIGLIALFTSYDHITFAGRTLQLPQQWGIAFILASVAIVFVVFVPYGAPLGRDAELASRARHRSENERLEARIRDDQERDRADQERSRADQERNRAAEARERQAQDAQRQSTDLAFLRRSALLSARVQLDPSDTNRAGLQAFLSLMTGQLPDDADDP
jgi:hypothetical protein